MSYRKLYLAPADPEDEDSQEDERLPPLYIHLRDARFVAPGSAPIPHNRGVPWRGTLNSVSGWSLGVLAAGDGKDESGHLGQE